MEHYRFGLPSYAKIDYSSPDGLRLDLSAKQPPTQHSSSQRREARKREKQRESPSSALHQAQSAPSGSSTTVPMISDPLPPFWNVTRRGPRPPTPPRGHSKKKNHEQSRAQEVPPVLAAPKPLRSDEVDARCLVKRLEDLSMDENHLTPPPFVHAQTPPCGVATVALPTKPRKTERTRDRSSTPGDKTRGGGSSNHLHVPIVPDSTTPPPQTVKTHRRRGKRDHSSIRPSPLRHAWN